ncbi:hypothetical protein FisN_27Lh064 [Fistulifera solaris]|uniref:J domain-containing protein n=1 Tax=Fistulifera solaris TaxID=1519565 RepID=A0A1Z5JQQ1_FISSO|nr:hypothetical protein FisN_27Lh064 [Fistulifera solaris]|eukprot:GAX16350.1 hypothetical protein FisN_27Lh064 [Fistulifera solaris]
MKSLFYFCYNGFIATALLLLLLPIIAPQETTNLYEILGVTRHATTKEIKQAYRRKALDTHPDKNTHLPAEEAAENFRQVARAFEILSDASSRQRYDRTGRTSESHQQHHHHQQQQKQQWTFTWKYARPQRLKDRFDVQQAQSRVLHVVSLEQLQIIILNDADVLERSLLISFVQPGTIETQVNDEMVFPYPFAGMSSQGIWWEDLLQTVQIRYHTPKHPLAQFFGLTAPLTEPVFFLARRGEPLQLSSFQTLTTQNRQTFDKWVWEQLEVDIQFINQHDHPVEVYWIHGNRAHIKMTLQAGEQATHRSMLSHEWWIRDARVDTRRDSPGRYKLTDHTCLASWKITNDTSPQVMIIERKTCYDLSGHCGFWKSQGECRKNPVFMGEECRKTCELCSENEDANQHDEF